MIDLNKKYIVVYDSENKIIVNEIENTGYVYPAVGLFYFETDNKDEFDNFIIENNLIENDGIN